MKKLRKSLGNEGFTLVELIIVIAIIAALVAILAPQYLKYVEKSRITADQNTVSEMVQALKVASVDDNYSATFAAGTITLSKSAAPTGVDSYDAALKEYFGDNYKDVRLKSKQYSGGVTISITVGTNGSWNITSSALTPVS